MRVRLKHRALVGKKLLGPGIVDWPEDVDLPRTAQKVTADAKDEKAPEPKEPDTLKGMQDKSPSEKAKK